MANHFKQIQVELERMGFEYTSTNSKGGQTWTHPAHTQVIYPGMKEHTHRLALRDIRKALGIKVDVNKRNTDNIKERQAKERDIKRAEWEAHQAWLEARIREMETANSIHGLTPKQQQLLDQRLRELADLRRLMSQTPTG